MESGEAGGLGDQVRKFYSVLTATEINQIGIWSNPSDCGVVEGLQEVSVDTGSPGGRPSMVHRDVDKETGRWASWAPGRRSPRPPEIARDCR